MTDELHLTLCALSLESWFSATLSCLWSEKKVFGNVIVGEKKQVYSIAEWSALYMTITDDRPAVN